MNRVFTTVLDLFYPPKCVCCSKILAKGEDGVCTACRAKLPLNDMERTVAAGCVCRAPFSYEGIIKESLLRYKFSGAVSYSRTYARLLKETASGVTADLITWIPVSRKRKWERGYDQSELLAEELAKVMKIPCASVLMKKHTPRQSASKSAAERVKNVAGAFSVRNQVQISGKRLLLVDDICTTGATLSEASRILLMSGAAEVSCITLAITQSNG